MKKGLQTLVLGFSLILLFSLKAEARISTNIPMTPDAARSADAARSTDPSVMREAPAGEPSSIFSTHITSTSPTYLLKTDSVSSTTHITLYLNEPVPTGDSTSFLFDGHFVPIIHSNPGRTKITIAITGNYLGEARMSELKVCEGMSSCSEPYPIQICSNDAACTPTIMPAPIPREIPAEAPPVNPPPVRCTDCDGTITQTPPAATTPTTTPPVATAPTATPPAGPTFTPQSSGSESGGCSFSTALPASISLGLFASFFLQILGLVVWRFKK